SERTSLNGQLLTAREKIKELEKNIAALEQVAIKELKPPVGPIPKIEGTVTDVDTKEKTAQINVGKDDGVVEGMEFIISRGRKEYLATLIVTKVTPSSAAGILSLVRGKVRRKDDVANTLKP
ncbi:MAG: hypothetical protein QF662_04375, partial [Phycisphaerae bacterium]|nr:hypothetical protein [Phycisphaerae bacterium]